MDGQGSFRDGLDLGASRHGLDSDCSARGGGYLRLLEVVLVHVLAAGVAGPVLVGVLSVLIRNLLFALLLLLLPAARALQLVDVLQVLLGEPLDARVLGCSVAARLGLRVVAMASA